MTLSRKLLLGFLTLGLFFGMAFIPEVIFGNNEMNSPPLQEFHERLLPLFTLPGVVYTDVIEGENRLEVGVARRESFPAVAAELRQLKIPRGLVDIVTAKPILPMATLRESIRPLQGGPQIAFSQFLCTLGFNVTRAGIEGFVMNAHCTDREGSVEGTEHYQPTVTALNFIGTETADPPFFRGGSCPKGKKCRRSDSAYDELAAGVTADLGSLARPDGVNTGSITVAGSFRIVGEAPSNAPVNTVLNKVGRTTGWSQGKVTKSCANTAVSGSNVIQLCQDWVKAKVGSGDSSSPVFKITDSPLKDDVELYGLLWGGSSDGTTFVYSPMANIERTDELGPLVNCASGFSC